MSKKPSAYPTPSLIRSSAAEYLTFVAATGQTDTSVEMRYENENIWLTQKMMATLYDVDVRTINEHLQKVFSDGELTEQEATVRNFRIVQTEGERQVARDTKHYNLQAILGLRCQRRRHQALFCSSSKQNALRSPWANCRRSDR